MSLTRPRDGSSASRVRDLPVDAAHQLEVAPSPGPSWTGEVVRWFVCLGVWVACLPGLVPDVAVSDRGTFVSVAERLAAGDRLYVDVWDNQDPLFFYANGLVRWVSPWLDPVLEVGWACLAAAGLAMVARHLGVRHATPLAWTVMPLAIVGRFVLAGHTHLPGTAVALLVMGLLVTGRSRGAGLALGVLLFLKVTIAPVALVAVVAWLAARRDAKAFARGLAGACAAIACCVLVMFARGDLVGYVAAIGSNVGYTDPGWLGSDQNPLLAHLSRVRSRYSAIAVAVLGVALAWAGAGRDRVEGDLVRPLWWAAVASFGSAVGVLAATAYWPHHLQALTFPTALVIAIVARRLANRPTVVVWLAVPLVAWLGAGAVSPQAVSGSFLHAPQALVRSATPAPITAGLVDGASASFARLGQNSSGEGTGLRGWTLSCRRFHQYPFEPAQAFEETVDCLPKAEVVLVSDNFTIQAGRNEWNRFVAQSEERLADGFGCEAVEGGRVCRRRAV